MKIPSLVELIKSKLLIAGLLFLGVNLTYSYMFYQVNSYKIAMVLVGVSILAIWHDLIFPQRTDKRIPWKQILIVSIPLLATFPGYIWHQGNYNYNFRYELASNLVLIVWVAYLYRGVKEKEDFHPFFLFIGITVIYVGIIAFLERFGYSPFSFGAPPVTRVKSTFGNINYFAGFLVVLTPLLLSFCFPEKLADSLSFKKLYPNTQKATAFYYLVFIIAAISLYLTGTRAAQGATIVSLAFVIYFYFLSFVSKKWQKRVLMAGIVVILLGIITLSLLIVNAEHLPQSRYTKLLTLEGWTPRFAGWVPAINSIKASPVIGFGLGSSYNLYFQFTDPNSRLLTTEHSYNHVHSEILEYIQEAGVLGFIFYAGFWIYLAYQLIKLMRSQQIDPFYKKLAIGIIGGFIGYHIQGSFSVAPRMMVTKLPLFTLIGLTLISVKLSNPEVEWQSSTKISDRMIAILPAFIVLVLVWTIFTPWLLGQYYFVKIQQERPSLFKVEKLEKMVAKYPDAYALDYLAHLQVQYKRVPQLAKTVQTIDKVLPNYRELGHSKAILAILQGDLARAKKVALDYQINQDRYHKPTIFLLMGLAFDTNDYQLFKEQFQLFVRSLVYNSRLYYDLDPAAVKIEIQNIKPAFQVDDQAGKFIFQWNEKLISNLFEVARSVRFRKAFNQKEFSSFMSNIAYLFTRHPYFQIKIDPQYRDDKSAHEINEKMRTYFQNNQEWSEKSQQITNQNNLQLLRTPSAERPALQRKQQEEMEAAGLPYREKMEENAEYLKERTDWDRFLEKRNFINLFINQLVVVLYPQEYRKES